MYTALKLRSCQTRTVVLQGNLQAYCHFGTCMYDHEIALLVYATLEVLVADDI